MNDISVFFAHIEEAAAQEGLPLAEVCRRAKSFGFDAVEMDAARLAAEDGPVLLAAARDAGLRVNCVNTFFNFGASEDSAADASAIDDAVALAKRAGSAKILAIPGFLTDAEMTRTSAAFARRRARMAEAMRALCGKAAAAGVTVLMEDFDLDRAPFYNAEELLWFMENVEGLRCAFDTGNFLYAEEDASAVLEQFLPYIGLVHCKDRSLAENDGDPKTTVAGRTLYPAAVGGGEIGIEGIVRRVVSAGYTGTFAAEHYGSKHQLSDMERSANYLHRVLG